MRGEDGVGALGNHLGGMYGIKEYVEYAGYGVISLYTQLIWGQAQYGCTFDTFMAEINAGRPALVHVEGHTMFGYGYEWDDTLGQHEDLYP